VEGRFGPWRGVKRACERGRAAPGRRHPGGKGLPAAAPTDGAYWVLPSCIVAAMGAVNPPFTYAVSDAAYVTAVLHAAKHVGAVHGLLLGRKSGDVATIVQALPVAHSALASGTSPVSEMALLLARAHAQMSGLVVAGVYYAPELADDTDIPALPARLADLARDECDFACLLVLDAKKLHPDVRRAGHCFRLYATGQGPRTAWANGTGDASRLAVSSSALAACHEKLKSVANAQGVIDFEDHCLDPGRAWL
jgi:Uncharacterised protein family (UPF0172)